MTKKHKVDDAELDKVSGGGSIPVDVGPNKDSLDARGGTPSPATGGEVEDSDLDQVSGGTTVPVRHGPDESSLDSGGRGSGD